MQDVLGEALKDYQQGNGRYKLWIHNKYGRKEEMPVPVYFRSEKDMSPGELLAMEGCTGQVLDIGAAAGCHSLILQQRNFPVTAMDISAGAVWVMKQRGVKKVIQADIFSWKKKQFDTLLFLMNGIGLAGTLNGLQILLHHLKQLLKPGGHILFDSSDVKYMYAPKKFPAHYYGEIDYRYEYRGNFSAWFKWLYADQLTMQSIASHCGFTMEVLEEDDSGQYFGRLMLQ
ncbi:class I SAM-dependent methyltransferase [Parafilimonas terrae]|uniref:Methyltransferase domain-containing protein n=1 Tax=Parafilimonas terrae TaxID=1465490 RepID=A0A1I5SG95_9BACT|nr:methyltransferase domain-containing protein [Parafilimonas terrae]SFP69527.1 Methyltransferase domain-containing protein [Parafilimonas terrae]